MNYKNIFLRLGLLSFILAAFFLVNNFAQAAELRVYLCKCNSGKVIRNTTCNIASCESYCAQQDAGDKGVSGCETITINDGNFCFCRNQQTGSDTKPFQTMVDCATNSGKGNCDTLCSNKGFAFSGCTKVGAGNIAPGSLPGTSNPQNLEPIAPPPPFPNPLSSISSPQALVGKIINAILGIVGSLALLMFVYGGLIYMTSSGNQEKVKEGRNVIVWSAIGMFVIFVSYGLVRLLLENIK